MAKMSKEQLIATIQECSVKVGHVPSYEELKETMQVQTWVIKKYFGTYRRALEEIGMERYGKGYVLDQKTLYMDWARVTRELGWVPKASEYEERGHHKPRSLVNRSGGWRNVPRCFLEYIRKEHLEGDWKDVQEVVFRYLATPYRQGGPASIVPSFPSRPQIMLDQPMYGGPMLNSPLAFAPINESAVVFLFGAVARQMGFLVTRLQTEFPDCEALRQIDRDRWQLKRIEFEYESRNFLLHQHRVEDCDMIVCWRHNWPECPLEVLELRSIAWEQIEQSGFSVNPVSR